jgi:hypothetical protein
VVTTTRGATEKKTMTGTTEMKTMTPATEPPARVAA